LTVAGALIKALGRRGVKAEYASATGPSADVSVGTGAAANIDVSVSLSGGAFLTTPTIVLLTEVSGLPDGVVLAGWSFPSKSTSSITVRLRVYNPTSADITVSADSVTVKIVAIE